MLWIHGMARREKPATRQEQEGALGNTYRAPRWRRWMTPTLHAFGVTAAANPADGADPLPLATVRGASLKNLYSA